jgi:hypothetical protein
MKVNVEHFLAGGLTICKQEIDSFTPDATFA